MEVVLGDLVVVLQAADMVMAVAADVACGDAGVLNAFSDLLGYFASTLLCELGDGEADDGAVVAGIEALAPPSPPCAPARPWPWPTKRCWSWPASS